MIYRSFFLAVFLGVLGMVIYLTTDASARDLFLGRQKPLPPDANINPPDNENAKPLKGSPELFNRSTEDMSPYAAPGLRKNTQKIKDFKMPDTWMVLLDETSRNIKTAETEHVIKEQKEYEVKMSAFYAKANAESQQRLSQQRADEIATIGAKPRNGKTEEELKLEKQGGGNKQVEKTSVIKKKKDISLGKPNKVFNSP